jgi:hypothetical protein
MSASQPQRRLSIPMEGDYTEYEHVEHSHIINKKTPKQEHILGQRAASGVLIGIIGTTTFYSQADADQLMQSVSDLWSHPKQIIFAQGGTLSMYIDLWADKHRVESIPLEADWKTAGPRACYEVARRIEREATHFIIVRSPRSRTDKSLQKAEYLAKKREVIILQGYDKEAEHPNTLLLDLLVPPPKPVKKQKEVVVPQNHLLTYFQKKT